jgi:hypothetical protein
MSNSFSRHRQTEAQRTRQQELFDTQLKQFWLQAKREADRAEPNRAHILRAIVDGDTWFVAVKPDGSFEATDVEAGAYPLLADPDVAAPNPDAKQTRQGQGGRLLPLYAAPPDHPTVQTDGRTLARALPKDIAGLLLHLPDRAPQELRQECFADLVALADAFDLEAILLEPGPNQVEKLKRATWFVELAGGALCPSTGLGAGRLVEVYTHRDRAGYRSSRLVAVTGEHLFRLVAEHVEVDGIIVNSSSQLGRGANILHRLALSPGFAHRLLEGEDIRPGAYPLPARSREEVEIWLELHGFPWRGRKWVETPMAEGVVVRVMVPQASEWRMQETLGQQVPLPGPTWSPAFTLLAGDATPSARGETRAQGLGAGPTRILCAGLLAKELGAGAYRGWDAQRCWRVGSWLLVGRLLNKEDRARSRRRLVLALELAKLRPPQAACIPRSALLSVKGAAVMGQHPHGGMRGWIEATVWQAARYTKRWVWGG